ncbi:MAG: T9SS type A sorting domain-containing protein [Sphingobacteriales bacterium]|nr:MAG: T9SS type A sorting domain-containing protein [Sphingobacteriales bacterium]
MKPLSIRLYICSLFFLLAATAVLAQSQPHYRILSLEYDPGAIGWKRHQKNSYSYSSDRNSILDWDRMQNGIYSMGAVPGLNYDEMYAEQNFVGNRPSPYYYAQQTFDNNGRLFTRKLTEISYSGDVYYDTVLYNMQGDTTVNIMMGGSVFTYYRGANSRLDSIIEYDAVYNKYRSREYYYYNGQSSRLEHKLYMDVYTSFGMPPDTSRYYEYYTYDSQGRIEKMKTAGSSLYAVFDTIQMVTYEYDNAGNRIQETNFGWDAAERKFKKLAGYIYTYTQDNKVLTKLQRRYDTSGTHYTDTAELTNYTYDGFGLPHILQRKAWGSGRFPDTAYKMRYVETYTAIYELFWPTAVAEQQSTINNFTVYPVPASGNVSISGRFKEAQPLTVYINNLLGHKVKSWALAAAREYRHTFDIQNIPAGQYIITGDNGEEKVSRQFEVR